MTQATIGSRVQNAFLRDVLDGLRRRPRRIPSKYFYDKRGSQLFERICELDEYYLTRTEIGILRTSAADIAQAIGSGVELIEFGSGSSIKTRILLDRLSEPAAYVPVDISRRHLHEAAASIVHDYPHLDVKPVAADFTRPFEAPQVADARRRVVFFPGSTIGNFDAPDARQLLRRCATLVGAGGGLVLGIDLQKDRDVLEAAYNDPRGVTAEFNVNVLRRINRELHADFDLDAFAHRAFYNADAGRIEMHLLSRERQHVDIDDNRFDFDRGDSICTEHSHKYTIDAMRSESAAAGLELERVWTDPHDWFAVLYLVNESAEPRP